MISINLLKINYSDRSNSSRDRKFLGLVNISNLGNLRVRMLRILDYQMVRMLYLDRLIPKTLKIIILVRILT